MGANDFVNEVDASFTNPDDMEKKVQVIVSGDTVGNDFVDVSMTRCLSDCGFVSEINYGTAGVECGDWSDANTWAGQFDSLRIPQDGDYVRIGLGACVLIDIDECAMPKLKFLEINGLLKSRDDGTPRALKAHNIWIRAGELQIGTADARYNSIFTIMLLGDSRAYNWAFAGSTEVGNKALVVTGTLNLHGAIKATTKTRLTQSVYADSTAINVEDASGMIGHSTATGDNCTPAGSFRPRKGDTLAIASSNMDTKAIEYCEIEAVSGTHVTCRGDPFEYFHFGQGSTTGGSYEGVDMRSEVVVLDRSITIVAETDYFNEPGYTGPDSEYWGCRVLVADWMDTGHELDGQLQFRSGTVQMDYVEVKHCSQKGTWRAAVAFDLARAAGSLIQHSTIHSGHGIGVSMVNSESIVL